MTSTRRLSTPQTGRDCGGEHRDGELDGSCLNGPTRPSGPTGRGGRLKPGISRFESGEGHVHDRGAHEVPAPTHHTSRPRPSKVGIRRGGWAAHMEGCQRGLSGPLRKRCGVTPTRVRIPGPPRCGLVPHMRKLSARTRRNGSGASRSHRAGHERTRGARTVRSRRVCSAAAIGEPCSMVATDLCTVCEAGSIPVLSTGVPVRVRGRRVRARRGAAGCRPARAGP